MKIRLNIINKIKDLNTEEKKELSSSEIGIISQCANQITWAFIHEDIVKFTDTINEL